MAATKSIEQLAIGILGGGQLGRMLIQFATSWNVNFHILDPDPEAPCRELAKHFQVGDLQDESTVYEWGKQLDVVTIEIEKVSVAALKRLQAEGVKVYPQPEAIEIIQDKRLQKQFYQDNDIPTSPFVLTETLEDLKRYEDRFPAVHKIGRDGYDGRGVQVIRSKGDIEKGFDGPSVLEDLVSFEKELSVIVARRPSGEVKCFPAVELVYHPEQNMVDYLLSPARISSQAEEKAQQLAINVIEKLDLYGILAVEMFLLPSGELWVNEVAPRAHNSGHQTIEGNISSQFEQLLRAILDLPLADTATRSKSAMVNVLGAPDHEGIAQLAGWDVLLRESGVYLHTYGKRITKPYRKMGHVTILEEDDEQLAAKIQKIKAAVKFVSKV
ncbi:MAG: 5-(carboxyamino)imidazole ribonucleotide synthase [Cyclobacteriaceae bacterium]|nr:5-(carboxyamino)imidazole ribonucleotide synthase [Cyclobacteriaceae bacterium]MCH8516831.1 5-(carboxyamino)imidazole ribonucleotide synthase [Cyclobacteriaceae bacterium]